MEAHQVVVMDFEVWIGCKLSTWEFVSGEDFFQINWVGLVAGRFSLGSTRDLEMLCLTYYYSSRDKLTLS